MSDIGGAALAGGISGAGRGLGDFISKYREERKRNKESDAAFGAVGSAVEHMVKQGVLPEGVLGQYLEVSKGRAEQKRGFLQGLGQVINYTNQAEEMKARAADRESDNARSAQYLAIQQADADRRKSADERRSQFHGALAQYLRPQVMSVPVGGMSIPVPTQRRASPDYVAGLAAQHGVDVPEGIMRTLNNRVEEPFKPEMVDLGDGVTAMTTSRGSAIPMHKPQSQAAKPRTVRVRAEDPENPKETFTYEIPWEEFEQKRKAQQTSTPSKNLDRATAATFFKQAGGDPVKARELARNAGYIVN